MILALVACERATPPVTVPTVLVTERDIRVDGTLAVTLDPAAMAGWSSGHVIAELAQALRDRCASGPVEIVATGTLPYVTLFHVIFTAKNAGCSSNTFALVGETWRVPHRPYLAGDAPAKQIRLDAKMTETELDKLAAEIAANPPADGILIIPPRKMPVSKVLRFVRGTPPAMRRVFASGD